MLRRDFLKAAGSFAGAVYVPLIGRAASDDLGGGQIRLIVPFPAGGPTDIVARPLAQALGEALKAVFVIDNAAEQVARSALPQWRSRRPTAGPC
jgi:tripartite-type tricarboxylate transporter receptor subunit TctC